MKTLSTIAAAAALAACGAPAESQRQDWSDWQFIEERDHFTDRVAYGAAVYGFHSVMPRAITFMCSGEVAAVTFADGFFHMGQHLSVRVRVDTGDSWTMSARELSSGSYAVTNIESVQRFANEVREGRNTVVFRMGDDTMVVPLRGSTRAIDRFASNCDVVE